MQLTESADDLTTQVANEVRAILARRRLSQQVVADAAGWSQSYLARRMAGRRPFDLADLDRLSEVLDVPVGEFLPSISRRKRAAA